MNFEEVTNIVKCNCFNVDYTDKHGRDYHQAFCGLSIAGNVMQDARDIKRNLEQQGYEVTAIFHIAGTWTPQQVNEMAEGRRPIPPGSSPIYADFEAVRKSCLRTARNRSGTEPFAAWLVSVYCSASWSGSHFTTDAYGADMPERDKLRVLAYDVMRDMAFPHTSTDPAEIMRYFERAAMCPEALETARQAVKLYQQRCSTARSGTEPRANRG
ncbi:MAG: YozE family protein [Butyricicoccaceae bacterium]